MNWFEKYNFIGPNITDGCLEFRRRERLSQANPISIFTYTNDDRLKKNDHMLSDWALSVKIRDSYKCVECGSENKLHSHHIKSKAKYPELKYNLDNGITLCASCHADVHGGNIARGLISFPYDSSKKSGDMKTATAQAKCGMNKE